jgi:DUF1680 family protein
MKSEVRNSKSERNPKSEIRRSAFRVLCFRASDLGLLSEFGSRISAFLTLACFILSATTVTSTPHATLQPIPLGEARWTTGFWADRFELCRTQMLPGLGRLMESTNYSQFFRNFEIAAGFAEGRSRGASFNDGELYKLIEAASAVQAIAPSDYFDRSLDRSIAVIAQAQRADGYLHTPVLIRQRNGDTNAAPFQDRNNFELYNLGHLMSAACVHHQATGKTNLLAVACKAADFLAQALSNGPPDVLRSSVCPSHYMGLVALYRETGEARYLKLARDLFAQRSKIKDGGDDNQDRVPFEQQRSAIGHAVRANYLYAGAADMFLETGDASFWKPLLPIWTNLVSQKMHVTGGCGALYDGASPFGTKDQKNITRTHQAYGHNYELPNTTAHNETCAAIGSVLWNWRMFLATGEGRFMDVLELALYNGVLSGVALDGTNFFYTNPLRVTDPLPTDLRWPRTRVPYVSSFCCPPNLARTIAESAGYAYATSSNAILVNLYGASTLTTTLAGSGPAKLTQQTEFPWSGRVRIVVERCSGKEFALKLRIPGWAKEAALRVNNGPIQRSGDSAERRQTLGQETAALSRDAATGYWEIQRAWQPGDFVDLALPMSVRLLEANPLVEETLGQTALQRGPVIYCLESADLPAGVRVMDISVPDSAEFLVRYDQRLLGGVVALEGRALARQRGDWTGQLYRDIQPTPAREVPVRFVPYSVWANRGPSEMSVWLPLERSTN